MVPVQEVDIHTDKKVFLKVHLVRPYGSSVYSAEVIVYDSEYNPPFSSIVSFPEKSQSAHDAYERALKWCREYAAKHSYKILRVNNPCNAEFLDKGTQQSILNKLNINVLVEVNGA